MATFQIISYIFSAIGLVGMVLSTIMKSNKSILTFQSVNHGCGIVACLLLNGYSGAVMEGINLSRNLCVVLCGKLNRFLQYFFVGLSLVLGAVAILVFDGFHWLGLLPIIATVVFSAIIVSPNATEKSIKVGTVISTVLWAIYTALHLQNYIYMSTNVITAASAILYLARNWKKEA